VIELFASDLKNTSSKNNSGRLAPTANDFTAAATFTSTSSPKFCVVTLKETYR